MNKKTALSALVMLFLGVHLCRAASGKPNILFIAVDDLKPLLGCYGSEGIQSPHIDKLAAQGMVFLNNSCQQAVCGPSRASLMTGTYPDTTRIYDLRTKMREVVPETLTLPEHLQQFGYETVGCGKIFDNRCVVDLDVPSWSQPFGEGRGRFFPEGFQPPYKGFLDPEVEVQNRAFQAYLRENHINRRRDEAAYEKAFLRFDKIRPLDECKDVPDNAYIDGATALWAVNKMEELAKGEKPFFLAVGFTKPHLPFVAPKKYWDLYDRDRIELAKFRKKPEGAPDYAVHDSGELRGSYSGFPVHGPIPDEMHRRLIHGYRACVSYTDAQIGKVLKGLEALGLQDNTIVVLWGDHGWHLGDHEMFCKHSNYEQAVRSPLIISAPQRKAIGEKTESPSEFVDIFPTLCELADIPIPQRVEGKSLVPVLDDPGVEVREAALGQYPRDEDKMGYTLRDKRYRYVKWMKLDYYAGETTGLMDSHELYDYQTDPLETVNLAENPEYAEVVATFERLFKERGVAQER